MATPPISRGLMGAPAPNASAGSRMSAAIQRLRQRQQQQQQPPLPRQPQQRPPALPSAPLRPTGGGLPPRPGQGTTQSPGGIVPPHMQQGAPPPRAATQMSPPAAPSAPAPMPGSAQSPSTQAAPMRPAGAPAAPSGISQPVPGVVMPDAGRAPRPAGGLMGGVPPSTQPILLHRQPQQA